jgi:L-fucose isomerase-like protein
MNTNDTMNIAVYTLTSELHDEHAVAAVTKEFLTNLGFDHELRGADYDDYGTHSLDLIYVRTGGTEGIFRRLLPQLQQQSSRPFFLLTSGKSNSLAASLEILSYLRQQKLNGEVIHGSETYIRHRVELLARVGEIRRQLQGARLGVVGAPSDWLISSYADYQIVARRLGVKLVDVPIEELIDIIGQTPLHETTESSPSAAIRASLPGAQQIYEALKKVVAQHHLNGLTLRCFDLLTAVRNTGCLALAKLNSEGVVAGCEGDVPTLLSMMLAQAMTGVSGFQANPSRINPETGELLFAHCTIPLNMVERYEFDTHFESGIGVGIRGYMKEGPVTLFKVAGDLSRCFIAEGQLVRNQAQADLCRTQQIIQLDDKRLASYFLTEPIGNHHVIIPGHVGEALGALFAEINYI